MSAVGRLLTEDQLLCSICLDVFTDPVSTPCGHNFCKACITQHLSKDVPFQCPLCQKMFFPKPELQVNMLITEIVDVWRRSAGAGRPEQRAADPGNLQCDSCSETKRKALVFCVLLTFVCVVLSQTRQELPLKQENLQGVIEDIQQKMEEVKRSLQLSKEDACAFKPLKESVVAVLNELAEKQRTSEMELEQKFAETMKREIPKLLMRVELMRAQRYAVDVTLDPETAYSELILSDDGKQVRCCDSRRRVYDSPKRFTYSVYVLGIQSFFSGKFYFEVQVKEKTEWTLGVAKESVNRKGDVTLRPQNGYWTICLRNRSDYRALASPPVRLSLLSPPEKVGVFVDYEEGLVFFYDVDAAALIYSFTGCTFTERLHPFFDPSHNDNNENFAPLIIIPANPIE